MSKSSTKGAPAAPSAPAAGQTDWTAFFDLDWSGLIGKARRAAQDFAREIRAALPDLTGDDERQRRLEDARIEARRSPRGLAATEYALLALSDLVNPVILAASDWTEDEGASLFRALLRRWKQMLAEDHFTLDLNDVPHWMVAHTNDDERADAVCAMVELNAPLEVTLQERLTQTGSQKVVYEATWTVADDPTEIVVKQLFSNAAEGIRRELRPHPLSMRHPNIIETYHLANTARTPEVFLVERRLRPLNDTSRATGLSDAASLFVDIGAALAFLADQGLVHGDVKPDNIGYSDSRYVLLDFGICQPAGDFLRGDATPTGSLRTRAPELLVDEYAHSEKSDVWALGATVFNTLFSRFPLFRDGDPEIPRLQDDPAGKQRAEIVQMLRDRVMHNYETQLQDVDELRNRELRALLRAALEVDPNKRPTAADLITKAVRVLPPLVGTETTAPFAPSVELAQLEQFLSDHEADVRLLSEHEIENLIARVEVLRRASVARRYYRQAAVRVADAAYETIHDNALELNSTDRASLQAVHELAPEYVAPRDEEDDRRVQRLRNLLERSQKPVEVKPPGEDFIEVLKAALASDRIKEATAFTKAVRDFERTAVL